MSTVSPLFEVHMLNGDGKMGATEIARNFNELVGRLDSWCNNPEGQREWAIVKTKLEEAAFFAKKAMAKDKRNHE